MNRKIVSTLVALCLFVSLQGQAILHTNPVAQAASESYPAVLDDGNTLAWYIAHSDYITIDVGVTQWDDASGHNYNLVQTTDANEPAFAGDSITFDGSNDMLVYDFVPDTAQPFNVYIVYKQESYTSGDIFMRANTTTAIFSQSNAGDGWIRMIVGATYADVSGATTGEWVIIRAFVDGTDASKLQVNNNDADDTVGESTAVIAFLQIGGSSSGLYAHWSVKEIIIRSTTDTSDNETAIYNYLANKYGLPTI